MQEFTTVLKIGPFTVRKTEGNLQPGEIDTITIECYPEFVGSQEEDIIILVPDSIPEDRNGKLIKLSVNSCIPSVDLYDLDAIFYENHIVDCIEDFTCPKEVLKSLQPELVFIILLFKNKIKRLSFITSDRSTYHIRSSRKMPVFSLCQRVSHSYDVSRTLQSEPNTRRRGIDHTQGFIYTENYET